MKILVLSDSHGAESLICRAYDAERPDTVVFLGDGFGDFLYARDHHFSGDTVTYAVTGNCDPEYANEYVASQVMTAGGKKFFLAHGDKHHVRSGIECLCIDAGAYGCGYALYGHTHVQKKGSYAGVTAVNPGSIENGDYAVIAAENGRTDIRLTCLPWR